MTGQQAELLKFVADYQRDHAGASPSYAEMAEALGLKSKSGIRRIVAGLVERGQITLLPNRARSISVVRHAVTVAEFRAIVAQLVEQEGIDLVFGVLRDLERELAPRLKEAA